MVSNTSTKLKALVGVISLIFVALFPMAFRDRGIYIDEAWIGEQAKALLDHGTMITNLFRDYPPLDQPIVVYHKLLVWLGVASSAVFGWGLYSLRLVSALSGVIMLLAVYLHLATEESRRRAVIVLMILMWTPLVWETMRIFRPEMLVTCLGVAGYALLFRARKRTNIWLVLGAGLLSGLAGSAHPAGLAFAAAGVVALLSARQFREVALFLAAAVIGFFPYVSGYFTDRELFMQQLFHNETIGSMSGFHWWSPFVGLLEEHKRIFRQPMVVGISVMFVLSLFMTKKDRFKEHRFFWTYLVTLFVCGAMLPFPKISRYMLPLAPFFAMACARIVDDLISGMNLRPVALRYAFIVWLVVFGVYGGYALAHAAIIDRQAPLELATHRTFAEKMDKGTLVMATAKFIFPEVDSFTIESYWGAYASAKGQRNAEFLENYAAAQGVKYLVVDAEVLQVWNFDRRGQGNPFTRYKPVIMMPERGYYLYERAK